jgi:cyclopropane-fatty-acyl-phospholipid synthase
VYGISVSRRQIEYAQERTTQAGLSAKVRFELRDYRSGDSFHHVVSIEMYEAVGENVSGRTLYFRTSGGSASCPAARLWCKESPRINCSHEV